jgi:hypothetical protein
MHIEINLFLFYWKIKLNFRKYLFFERYRIDNEIEIDMIFEVFKKSNIKSPSSF